MTENNKSASINSLTTEMVLEWTLILLICGCATIIANWIGYNVSIIDAMPGVLLTVGVCLAGYILATILPVNINTTLWVLMVAVVVGSPIFPFSNEIKALVAKAQLMSFVPVILAYAGIAIGKDLETFKKIGWQSVLVSLVVMLSIFLFAGLFGEIVLRMS